MRSNWLSVNLVPGSTASWRLPSRACLLAATRSTLAGPGLSLHVFFDGPSGLTQEPEPDGVVLFKIEPFAY